VTRVAIENRTRRSRISIPKLTRLTKKILKLLQWKGPSLSVILVGDTEMRKLHRKYLGEDSPTDVLAFEGGDVAVSVDQAQRAGPRFGNAWDEELLLYVCHGVLHLMGWRDSTRLAKAKMDKKQEQILKKVLGPSWRSKKRKPLF